MGAILGGYQGVGLQAEEIMELQSQYYFTQTEIRRLYKRFRKLDTTKTGGITRSEVLKIPELSMNPLAQRIISLFHPPSSQDLLNGTRHDIINFRDFLKMLSIFSSKCPVIEKEKLAFNVYDIDNDGFISENELFEVLKTMVGDNVKDADLKEIVKRTIQEADTTGNGKLDFTEFQNVLREDGEDTISKMTIMFTEEDLRHE